MVAALLQIIAHDNVDLYVSNAFIQCIHVPFMLTKLSSSARLARPALFISRTAWPHLILSLTPRGRGLTKHPLHSPIAMLLSHPF